MAIAAVPDYLGKDFSQASPGLRFGMFLPVWEPGFAAKTKDKTDAWKSIKCLTPGDLKLMAALGQRQADLAAPLATNGRLLALDALAVAPFTTGLGNAHPLENGFAFLNPYGLPYLPGSGVKGVLRQAARELADHLWADDQDWTHEAIEALFGTADADGAEDGAFLRGALSFWDVLPQIEGKELLVEVMTPHQSHYYQNDTKSQNGANPHESGLPNPINFLTVPPGSKFAFHVLCDLTLLARSAPWLAEGGAWQGLVQAAMVHAFEWLGFGAKTAVGYGAMQLDAAASAQRAQQVAKWRDESAALAEQMRRQTMTPQQREADDAAGRLDAFIALLGEEQRLKRYKPGYAFDDKRNEFLKRSLEMIDETARRAAAGALRESYEITKWPGKKERKQEVKASLTQLDGQA